MKEITMYEANDGSKHSTKEQAIKRDDLLLKISEIEDLLPDKPKDKGCMFSNGKGYLPVDEKKFNLAKDKLMLLATEITGKDFQGNLHGIIGRYLDDSGSPAYSLLYRMQCVDNKFRMWGQPYFALNPMEGIQEQFKEIEIL